MQTKKVTFLPNKLWRTLAIALWTAALITFALGYYVNHYMPHGRIEATGDYQCANDERGPCYPGVVEDLKGVNIPKWAKFLRGGSGDNAFWYSIGLVILGSLCNARGRDHQSSN